MAGDKTAYLVTDLTVTAVTVMILNSGFLVQELSRSKHEFFLGTHSPWSVTDKYMKFLNFGSITVTVL